MKNRRTAQGARRKGKAKGVPNVGGGLRSVRPWRDLRQEDAEWGERRERRNAKCLGRIGQVTFETRHSLSLRTLCPCVRQFLWSLVSCLLFLQERPKAEGGLMSPRNSAVLQWSHRVTARCHRLTQLICDLTRNHQAFSQKRFKSQAEFLIFRPSV
jgi:hypothetical protein